MPTASQLKIQSPNAPTIESAFQKEWEQAQNDYNSAIRVGYSADDANRLYLQPVQQKWQIAASSPGIISDKKRFAEFNQEFDDARNQFISNYQSYSRDGGEWAATQPGSIVPTMQKWSVQSKLPIPQQADPFLSEKEGALQEAREGYNPQDIIRGHPQVIFSDPQFLGRFNTAASQGFKARSKQETLDTKRNAPQDALKLATRRAAFQKLEAGDPLMPASLKGLLDREISALEEQLTNPPPVQPTIDLRNPPVRFQPSAGAQPPPEALPNAPGGATSALRGSPTSFQAMPNAPAGAVIPKAAITYLLAHPETVGQFEEMYGKGSANAALSQQ